MSRIERSLAWAAAALMVNAVPARAQDISEAADLTAVIALNGKPCGEVVSYVIQGESDFLVITSRERSPR